MLFVITNQKGGVGKTTLSIIIAWWLRRAKRKVLLVDADASQANAIEWSLGLDEDELDEIESGQIYKSRLKYDVVWIISPFELTEDIIDNYDFIVVDGRPSDIVNTFFVQYADRIIVPFMKRKKDIKTTRSWLRELRKMGYGDKIVLFYNKYCEEIARGEKVPVWFVDYVMQKATGLIRIGNDFVSLDEIEGLEAEEIGL